jgi:hypothetical protein
MSRDALQCWPVVASRKCEGGDDSAFELFDGLDSLEPETFACFLFTFSLPWSRP